MLPNAHPRPSESLELQGLFLSELHLWAARQWRGRFTDEELTGGGAST
jgi:hypothetical protein